MFGNREKQLHERVATLQMELAQVHDIFIALDKSLSIIEFDRKGHVLAANQNFVNLFGYNTGEVQGAHHRIFCNASYAASPEYKSFWERLNQGQFFSGRFRRVHKNGNTIWLEATYNPVFNSVGTLQKIVKYATDITQRVKEESANQSVLEALDRSMAVVEFDLEGRILKANKNFLSLMGYEASELIGQHHKTLCKPAEASSEGYQALWSELRSGAFTTGQYERIRKDGQTVTLSATYNPCFDQDGRLERIIKIAQPVLY